VSRAIVPSPSLSKPGIETRFQIDYDWWERSGQELRLYLLQQLCEAHRQEFAGGSEVDTDFDWVNPDSGQIARVNRLVYTLLTHCSRQPEFVTARTSLVDAVFRVLLASGNRPMTPNDLAEQIGRAPDTILRTLSGKTVYKGIRPVSYE
jgi:hypothetical protein